MPKTTIVEFRANGRTAQGYLASPDSGSGPGVLVIQEWWGLVDHIKSVSERFAAAGFVALAPDLYRGESTTKPDEAGKLMMALDIAEAAKDLRGAADYLLAHERVQPKKIGTVGFCMGGQLALFAGCEHPEAIDAVVDFYGIHPAVKPDLDRLRAPVLAHFGKTDGFVAENDARALVSRLQAAGKNVDAHFYDTGHAFFNDARPEAHDPTASALAWDRTVTFFRKHLT